MVERVGSRLSLVEVITRGVLSSKTTGELNVTLNPLRGSGWKRVTVLVSVRLMTWSPRVRIKVKVRSTSPCWSSSYP